MPVLGRRRPARPRRQLLVAGVAAGCLLAVPGIVPARSFAPQVAAVAAAPSGGFAMHGGMGGQIDERTGQLSVTVPLTTVDGQGTAGVSVALSWQQERATAAVDRSGWGAGWSVGSSFVNVSGLKRVYPADGGTYFLDPTEPSGLLHYKLQDLTFTSETGILPRRPGAGQVSYSYELVYDDGRADYFDVNGNLAARTDRFGNRTDILWQARANNVWRPTSIIDSFGLTTTFDYSTADTVKVVSPQRSDTVIATTTIAVTSTQGVQSVKDPVGNLTSFTYAKPLLTRITAANGARTAVTYQTPAYQQGLTAVSTLSVTDAAGAALSPVQTFNLNPAGNNQHNFTGYPNHLGTGGQDALFASGDTAYTYSTSLATGTVTTLSTYDALHRLTDRQISVVPGVGQAPITTQTHEIEYPTPVRVPALLPATYAHPTQVTLTESAATSADGVTASPPRTATSSTTYDDHGRVVSATDEVGTTTTTEYDDRYGLVTTQTTTGTDGSQARQVNTLTDDGTNIHVSTTSFGTDGATLSARQQLTYEYDDDGQLATRTLAWAPGANPDADEPGGGPDEVVTTFDRSVDAANGVQKVTTTVAAGTDAAQAETATIDLVSGKAISHTDGLGRTTSMTYDAIGRQTRVDSPGGLTTTTAYTPTQTTVTGPDGRVTRTTVDQLGRTVSITDNVQNGALVASPAARSLSSHVYSADGSSVTSTDQAGRTTTTYVDPFGRTVSEVGPTGLTHRTSFDDGAGHSTRAEVLPEGSTQALMGTTTNLDDGGRAVRSETTYPTATGGGPGTDPVGSKSFDGLGQPTSSTRGDLTVVTDRSGEGGISAAATATPQATTDFPGEPITAVTTRALTGAATSRTLRQGDEVSTATTVVYDAAGHVVTATDAEGRDTTYTYADDGQPLTKTGHSGTVTTYAYDPTSGLQTGVTVTAPGRPTRAITFTRVPEGQPGAGQVKTVSDGTGPSGTITYGYDVDGHRTSVAYPDGTSTAADYNDRGQLATTTDVTGAVTTYTYDSGDGTLKSATQRRGTSTVASVVYTYDTMSRLLTTTRGNGTVTTNSYTPQNDLATQTTRDAAGKVLEAHSYTYDDHHNPATRTDTYAAGGSATATGGTWTTVYSYDAYDRLIGSAVYSGSLVDGAPTGLPLTATDYTVDVGGDVTATKTTSRLPGLRPITTTTSSTNTIDDSGRLTAQQTGSTTSVQTFDDDGRVLRSATGTATTYFTDGSPASTTLPNGTTTTYALWPDGSRRSATTADPSGDTSTVTYHYGVDGVLLNDSTSDASTAAGTATTASYLLTAGREARTLLAGTKPSGSVTGTPGAPIDTGTGVGYFLRDRHTSVTGLVDDTGAVTATFAYSDYGASVRADGRPVNLGVFDGGRTNPYTYLGAAPNGPATDPLTDLLAFADRTYDPLQGRFTSPDPIDAHNRYQGFNTNPIVYLDLSGQVSTSDIVIEAVFAVLMAVTAVLTGGAALAGGFAIAAALEAGVEVTAGVVANVALATVGTVANAVGAISGAILTTSDTIEATGGKDFLSADQRDTVNLITNVATAVAGATGLVQGATDAAVEAMEAETAVATTAPGYVPQPPAVVDANPVDAADQVAAPAADPPAPPADDANPPNGGAQQVDVDPPAPEQHANANQQIIEADAPQENPNAANTQDDAHAPRLPDALADELPGSEHLNLPDQSALNGERLVPVAADAGDLYQNLREQSTSSDPVTVTTADTLLSANAHPALPSREPGTFGPVDSFENANVILVSGQTTSKELVW